MEKKHITHHNLQHLSAHLLQHSTLIPASNPYKFQTIFLHPFCYMPGLAQASLRSGIPMPKSTLTKDGGSCWTRWTHYASSRTPNSTFCRLEKKNVKILTQQFFGPFFFPRKSHYGVYDIVDTTLPWHACDGQVSRFRATKIGLKRIKLPCHWHWSSRSWYPNRKLVFKKKANEPVLFLFAVVWKGKQPSKHRLMPSQFTITDYTKTRCCTGAFIASRRNGSPSSFRKNKKKNAKYQSTSSDLKMLNQLINVSGRITHYS